MNDMPEDVHPFTYAMHSRGFHRVEPEARNKRLSEICPNGDSQWRHATFPVTLSISNGGLSYNAANGRVYYMDAPGLVLNAIYIPAESRGLRYGRTALNLLMQACLHAGVSTVWLEPCQIKGLPGNRAKGTPGDSALVAWYTRAGFTPRQTTGRVKVMYWRPDGGRPD